MWRERNQNLIVLASVKKKNAQTLVAMWLSQKFLSMLLQLTLTILSRMYGQKCILIRINGIDH